MDNLLKPIDSARDSGYCDFAQSSQVLLASFEKALVENPTQDHQNLADAVVELIATPEGSRKFRRGCRQHGYGGAPGGLQ